MAKQTLNVPSLLTSYRFWGIVAFAVLTTAVNEGWVTQETLSVWTGVGQWIVGGATGVAILDRIGSKAK